MSHGFDAGGDSDFDWGAATGPGDGRASATFPTETRVNQSAVEFGGTRYLNRAWAE
jgi:hypothetical protein